MPRRRRGRRARLVVNGPARPGPGVRRRAVIKSVLRRPSRPPCSSGSAQQGGPGGERDGLGSQPSRSDGRDGEWLGLRRPRGSRDAAPSCRRPVPRCHGGESRRVEAMIARVESGASGVSRQWYDARPEAGPSSESAESRCSAAGPARLAMVPCVSATLRLSCRSNESSRSHSVL